VDRPHQGLLSAVVLICGDPQPPFDSGHLSKASAATKAAATAILGKDLVKPAQLKATTLLLWEQALRAACNRRRRRHRDVAVPSAG
jgi:hypothetical protein